ncbi:ankyrin repeat domain-containing protein [Ferruginibacter sp.]
MKKIFSILLVCTALCSRAQQNVFLDPSFWKANPDVAAVKAAMEKGNDPAEYNRMSMDPVVIAINNQASTETIKFLLAQKGNDVNKLTHDSRTYLFWAAVSGNADLVDHLLQKGAKMDVEDSHGTTPITFAANAGQKNTAIFDLFAKYGADLKKVTNHDGASLLLLAIAQDRDLALTNYFVAKGLDLNGTDNAGNTAFNYAAKSGNIELLKTLVDKGVKYTDNAFLMACQAGGGRGGGGGGPQGGGPQGGGQQGGGQAQQGRGGNPGGGRGPDFVALFQYLEGLKIKPTAVNSNGENALHLMARKPNQLPALTYLIGKGVDVNKPDNDGNTPFMVACTSNRDTATIALLLANVKNINQVNKKGVAALAMAVNSNAPVVISYLISKGADVKIKDGNGDNLAYYLVQSYSPQRGGFEDFDAKMKVLTDAGLDITAAQKNGNTLYHLAIAKSDLELLKRLESLKIDINAKNKEGLTVLHKAALTAKNDAILKYLVSIGAKKDITTEFKETAFDLAAENEALTKNKTNIDFLK